MTEPAASGLRRRGRAIAIVALLAAGGLGLLSATQPWAQAALVDGRALEVAGSQAAGALAVLSLAVVALALALALAGRVWRVVLAVLAVVLGVLLVAHALLSQAGVDAALDALVAEATGLAGSAQDAELVDRSSTAWPIAGAAGGVLAVLAGAWALATGGRWPTRAKRSARYERSGSGLAWDVMDDGEDPTR